jgi:hypothetical protein
LVVLAALYQHQLAEQSQPQVAIAFTLLPLSEQLTLLLAVLVALKY